MSSDHSTKPDIITGWQPQQLIPKLRQFPLIFVNQSVDKLTKSLTTFGNTFNFRVVYMGPRHTSNMKIFKNYCKNSKHEFLQDSAIYEQQQIERFPFNHSHEHQKFFPIRTSQYRLFTGMNPTLKKDDLQFDSDFECGNLDLAIYVNPVEYDLLMRIDSNTKGHTAWFFFKVSTPSLSNQKVKFNIINYGKKQLLFKDGMKPYTFKKSTGKWSQIGISINYNKRAFRYQGSQHVLSQSLSFIYQFKDTEPVYFAYCIPYSYSYLQHRLKYFQTKSPHLIKINYENESTGGLPLPLVTITNFSTTSKKQTVLAIARLHPGQTQGSWMMDGFIKYLLSPQGHYLRERNIFKIVPMVNVDGVVLGNFRTGIMGRDLNRSFSHHQPYSQIRLIKNLAVQHEANVFLDFHGHSAKRNVFIYGPDYKIQDKNYLPARVFPKIISKNCEAFRYYSCIFKINSSKKTTGRAVMLNELNVAFSFTIEASSHAYGYRKNEVLFTSDLYKQVGFKIGNSLTEFIKFLKILPRRQQIKHQKQKKEKQKEEKKVKTRKDNQEKSFKKLLDATEELEQSTKQLLQEIIRDQAEMDKEQSQKSEDSDCEDASEDYSMSDLKSILDNKFDSHVATKDLKKKEKYKKKPREAIQQKKFQIPIEERMKSFKEFLTQNKKTNNKIKKQFERKQNTSETIELLSNNQKNYISFESRKSKILHNNPDYISNIIRKPKEQQRNHSQTKDNFQTIQSEQRKNFVHYDWNQKKQRQSYKYFTFDISEAEQKESKQKQRKPKLKKILSLEKKRKKNTPILSIKKSILPMVGRKSEEESSQYFNKSMLGQILQEHERKKKVHKNVKIMFL